MANSYRTRSNERWQALALNALGFYSAQAEHYDDALEYCEQALTLNVKLDAIVDQASTWDSIGFVHHRQGRLHQAVECFRRSLDLSGQTGHRPDEADALDHLGDTREALSDLPAARKSWQQALDALENQGSNPMVQAIRAKLDRLDRERRGPVG